MNVRVLSSGPAVARHNRRQDAQRGLPALWSAADLVDPAPAGCENGHFGAVQGDAGGLGGLWSPRGGNQAVGEIDCGTAGASRPIGAREVTP